MPPGQSRRKCLPAEAWLPRSLELGKWMAHSRDARGHAGRNQIVRGTRTGFPPWLPPPWTLAPRYATVTDALPLGEDWPGASEVR